MNLNGNGADHGRRSDAKVADAAKATDALLGSVDVHVETYLGETVMTVAQLNDLKVGGIVSLDAALNDPVELRINGVRVAVGELVAVGDRFGVRIVTIS